MERESRDCQIEISARGRVWRDYWRAPWGPEVNTFTRAEAERYVALQRRIGSPYNYRIIEGGMHDDEKRQSDDADRAGQGV